MPMQVSQIFLTDDGGRDLPPPLETAVGTVRLKFPHASHVIYNNDTLRQFIDEHYDPDVLRAYDCLRPYAYKADLGRFCLLNKLGGWYVDIAVQVVNPANVKKHIKFLAFREMQRYSFTSWACATAVLYSKPDNAALVTAINLIVKNCREKYYGISPLCPTGPTLLGQALAINGSSAEFIYGDCLELTPAYQQKNKAFVLPDGTIMAWSKSTASGGDLTGMGAKGVNNYNELWHAGKVYKK
jgi:mannosyltransferase OCH1-like enzyme